MNMPKPDDWLDALLEDEPYVEDEGFTEAVVARLPTRRRSSRSFVLTLATAFAGIVFLALDGGHLVSLVGKLGDAVSGDSLLALSVQPTVSTFVALAAVATLLWLPYTIALEE